MSDLLELLGVACLVLFAVLLWWPAALLVTGLYLLAASFGLHKSAETPSESVGGRWQARRAAR